MNRKEVLEIKDIHAIVEGSEVVKGVSLTVRPGEVHVIMGQNGSGKSSLVNALMGHPKFETVSGALTVGDRELLHEKTDVKARAGLFLSMQHLPEIGGITLAYFLHQAQKALREDSMPIMDFYNAAKEKAAAVGIEPELLDRPLHAGLSGGEKKQSEIIQLMMLEPSFAFLDEIDSGVDRDALEKVWKAVTLLRESGTGFVLVTHYPSILQQITPDKVHVMAGGEVVATGGAELAKKIEQHGFKELG